jgi:toxin ParE1/3/4
MSGRPLYRLSPLAEADLEDIWLHSVNIWSVEQADSYLRGLFDAFAGLASGSKIGRAVDLREGYLKYLTGSHIVYYRLGVGSLDVIRVLHQRMDVSRHLR